MTRRRATSTQRWRCSWRWSRGSPTWRSSQLHGSWLSGPAARAQRRARAAARWDAQRTRGVPQDGG
eukprot:870293-Prymnesium_polylepis.1